MPVKFMGTTPPPEIPDKILPGYPGVPKLPTQVQQRVNDFQNMWDQGSNLWWNNLINPLGEAGDAILRYSGAYDAAHGAVDNINRDAYNTLIDVNPYARADVMRNQANQSRQNQQQRFMGINDRGPNAQQQDNRDTRQTADEMSYTSPEGAGYTPFSLLNTQDYAPRQLSLGGSKDLNGNALPGGLTWRETIFGVPQKQTQQQGSNPGWWYGSSGGGGYGGSSYRSPSYNDLQSYYRSLVSWRF